jgi:hypothetical protein
MKKLLLLLLVLPQLLCAQELFVYSEPASNMPAHSISAKLTGQFILDRNYASQSRQRYKPEVMFGANRKWMLHASATFSDMYSPGLRFESVAAYAKYRFLSHDDIHKHFRMAAFADISFTRSEFIYNELSLTGDKSGVELGLIATQLWNKIAVSGTVGTIQSLDRSRFDKVVYTPGRKYQSLNYILSAGYLLLPRKYTSYRQLNLNLYTEFIAQQLLDGKGYYFDMASALQFIFNSNFKLNIGHRTQLSGNMSRMTHNSWQISIERTFLNALK